MTASRPMSPQQDPSTGGVPEGQPDTTQGHPSRTGTTPEQDREAMPPPAPRPPQQRDTDPLDREGLGAIYDIHANTPPCELVATLWRHHQDINPNRLFAVVPLLHAAATNISVRQLQGLVGPGMKIADDLVGVDLIYHLQPGGP